MNILTALGIALSFAPPLINGEIAPEGMFPFVVGLGGCTATKVSPRHFLLAAHCIYSGPGEYRPPSRIRVGGRSLRVKSADIHPSWIEHCRASGCTGHESGSTRDHPGKVDLALIQVTEDTPSIPSIEIETAPIPVHSEVTLAGYGCTRGIGVGESYQLRFGNTRTESHLLLQHEGSLYRHISEIAASSYLITPGTSFDPKAPALCPGDSGGPLLLRAGDTMRVAGVAADYTFTGAYERRGAIPMSNLHTRLDSESMHRVGDWITAHW